MRGQDQQPGAVHVDESHHCVLIPGTRVWCSRLGTALVAVVDRGLVAVMSVRNDHLLVAHLAANGIDDVGIGNLPHSIDDSIFVGDFDLGCCLQRRGEQGINLSRILIHHEELFEVGAGGAQQFEPVGLGLGQCLLMPVDDVRRIVLKPPQRNEPSPLGLDRRLRSLEALRIDIDRRFYIAT